MAASSAQHSAPEIVISPAIAQARTNQPGEPTKRNDSAETMKIPDPIIDPTTIIVASSNPSARGRLECWSRSLLVGAMAVPSVAIDHGGSLVEVTVEQNITSWIGAVRCGSLNIGGAPRAQSLVLKYLLRST